MADLTPRQQEVLTSLRNMDPEVTPSLNLLADRLGVHYVTLRQHIKALERKGYLRMRSHGRGRAPTITLQHQPAGIPIAGAIRAGGLHEALQDPEGYLALPATADTFALRVTGASMADLIQDGDLVLLRRDVDWMNGAICAVRVGEQATLKHLTRDGSHVILKPHNPRYPTTRYHASEVQVDGVYQGLLRGSAARTLRLS